MAIYIFIYPTCSNLGDELMMFLVAGSGSCHFGWSRLGAAAAAGAHGHDGIFWALSW